MRRYCLSTCGVDHVVLEEGKAGGAVEQPERCARDRTRETARNSAPSLTSAASPLVIPGSPRPGKEQA
jgi:hypothetical protein